MMYLKSKNYDNLNKNGFTLVEVLVSLSLLLVVLVGPLTFLASSSQSAQIANEQIIATFLAQEGAEIVHKVRDDELMAWFRRGFTGTPWQNMKNTLAPCFTNNGCGLELDAGEGVQTASIHSCGGGNDCRLYLYEGDSYDSRSRYSYSDGGNFTATPYTRVIYLNEVGGPDREIEIISEVRWRSGSLIEEQVVEVETSIFNAYDTN